MNGRFTKNLNIRASINKGLSKKLSIAFPNTNLIERPLVNIELINNFNWLVGFVDGEGCFYVKKKKINTLLGFQISLSFSIYQHSRDEILLEKLIDLLGCGKIEKVNRDLIQLFLLYINLMIFVKKLFLFFKIILYKV